MPLYEYQCTECGKIEEAIQKFSDTPLTVCRHCSGKMNKLISQSSFHLKGTGWYVTDYSKKSTSTADTKKPESTTADSKKSDIGSSETKAPKSDD
jgi:putative FmdB family regulatory protein